VEVIAVTGLHKRYGKLQDRFNQYGYTTYELRQSRILGESTIQRMRHGQNVSADTILRLSRLFCCKPTDLMDDPPTACSNEARIVEWKAYLASLGFGAYDESDRQPDPERLTALTALFAATEE
jgi:DNA-binding Xre family transcriptional regulator